MWYQLISNSESLLLNVLISKREGSAMWKEGAAQEVGEEFDSRVLRAVARAAAEAILLLGQTYS